MLIIYISLRIPYKYTPTVSVLEITVPIVRLAKGHDYKIPCDALEGELKGSAWKV